jgi:hypothetical protein
MTYAVVLEKAAHNWAAYVPDLPGCITTGPTLASACPCARPCPDRPPTANGFGVVNAEYCVSPPSPSGLHPRRHPGSIGLSGSGLLLAILRLALLPPLVASEAPGRPLRQITLRRRPKGVPSARGSPQTVLP